MNINNVNRRTALCALAAPTFAHAGPRSCYRMASVPGSAPAGLTIALIDSTTGKDPQVLSSFASLVYKAMAKPNERVVVASFAGLAPGQFPDVKADVVHEPQPSSELVEAHVLDWTQRMRACLGKLSAGNAQAVRGAIKASIASQTTTPFSEIVAALRWATLDLTRQLQPVVVAPTKLIVYSDGELNSKTGTSFYRNGAPREISAAEELQVFRRNEGQDAAPHTHTMDVWWVGIGLQPPGVKVYMTPRAIDERRRFWTGVLNAYGARHINLGLTLPNDSL